MSDTKKPTKAVTTAYENKHLMFVTSVMIDEETNQPVANFVGFPLVEDSAFIEVIFDPKKQVLGVVSKNKKESFHWIPRVDADGMPIATKNKSMVQQQPIQQQRVQLETYHEYYIRDKKSIVEFIEMHMINSFDYSTFIK